MADVSSDSWTGEWANKMLAAISRAQSAALANRDLQSLTDDLLAIFLDTTKSQYGFISKVMYDHTGTRYIKTLSLSNIAWNDETNRLYQQTKREGMTFRNLESLWGKVVTTEKPVISNSPNEDVRASGIPDGHPPMTSFLGMPTFRQGTMTGVVGIANREAGYSEDYVEFLEPLLNACATVIEAFQREQHRQDIEQRLKKSEERLQLAQAVANLGSWEWNILDGTLILSPGVLTNFGLTDDGEPHTFEDWQQWIHPDDRERVVRSVNKTLVGTSPLDIEYRIIWPDGSVHWVSDKGKVFCDPMGKAVRVVGINADITEQKKTDIQLREMNLAVSNAMPASSRLDTTGKYVHVSDSYASLIGYEPSELEGQLWQVTVWEEDVPAAIAVYDEMLRSGRGEGEVRGVRKDGSVFFKQILLIRIDDSQGCVAGHYCFMQDVDEQRLLERKVEQLRDRMRTVSRLNMMGEMAAGLAHELNQPLAALVNNAFVARKILKRKDGGYEERLDDLLEKLENQALHAGEIIRGLRKIVRKEPPSRDSIDINSLINEVLLVIEPEAKAGRIRVTTELGHSLPKAEVDRVQIQQVLLNLLRNAVEEMVANTPANKRILRITSAMTEHEAIQVTVEDSGPGLPKDNTESVFDAFYSTKLDGMGMGLPICRSIIESHGGRIRIDSGSQSGATVLFTLPRIAKNKATHSP